MTLYEINAAMEAAMMDAIDTETGEILDGEMAERFEQLSIDRDTKIENIACMIKNLRAEAEALKVEKLAFAARQKVAESKADSLTKYLASVLDGEKFSSVRAKVTWRKSESVQIEDITKIPADYVTYTPTADKTGIKASLKAGGEVPGATLVTNQNMVIR